MFNRLTGFRRGHVPNLVVAKRVIDRMRAAVDAFMEDETGEAMVGLLVPGMHTNAIPTLYVLDTIPPDESAVRAMHTFQQGDARQDELIWWLQENWHLQRQSNQGKWDVPLRYLGDWHKQPGFMIQPSTGDLMTALDWIADADNHADFLLAPIVTLDHPLTIADSPGAANFIMIPRGENAAMRVDFWYIDRKTRAFLPITPAIYPDEQLPKLAPYPWHLLNEERFDLEYRRMKEDGLFAALVLWNADEAPPLEVCFLTARAGSEKMIMAVTPYDYPAHPPQFRAAPMAAMKDNESMYDVFKQAWGESRLISVSWTPDMHLIDAIRAVEAKIGTEEAS
jgi:hypothetical protein